MREPVRSSAVGESLVSDQFSPFIAAPPGGETMEFSWIKPGRFTMGTLQSEGGRGEDECPRHEVVKTGDFYIGTHEVCAPPTDQLVVPVTEEILISDSELCVEVGLRTNDSVSKKF